MPAISEHQWDQIARTIDYAEGRINHEEDMASYHGGGHQDEKGRAMIRDAREGLAAIKPSPPMTEAEIREEIRRLNFEMSKVGPVDLSHCVVT